MLTAVTTGELGCRIRKKIVCVLSQGGAHHMLCVMVIVWDQFKACVGVSTPAVDHQRHSISTQLPPVFHRPTM